MPVINVNVGRIDFGSCSGMIYSYEPIDSKTEVTVDGVRITIRTVTSIGIQTPDGYVLEEVNDPSPNGDTESARMVFDPGETARNSSGRVYMRAARLVERMRSGFGGFKQVD
jgi:hypothetical protein